MAAYVGIDNLGSEDKPNFRFTEYSNLDALVQSNHEKKGKEFKPNNKPDNWGLFIGHYVLISGIQEPETEQIEYRFLLHSQQLPPLEQEYGWQNTRTRRLVRLLP